MKKENKTKILLLGTFGFPFGSATVQRQLQLAKSLNEAGLYVTIINRRSPHSKEITRRESILKHGFFEGIEYYYSSILHYKHSNIFIRNYNKLSGILFEPFYLIYYFLFKNVKYILYRSDSLIRSKYYYYLSKIFGVEIIYDYVELYDSIRNKQGDTNFLSKRKFDDNFFKYTDKIIVISDYLRNHLVSKNINRPIIKIPPTIDFSYFDDLIVKAPNSQFYLFCGSATYYDIIKFIIKSYKKSKAKKNGYILKLILNGNNKDIEDLKIYIRDNELKQLIIIKTKISYIELLSYYKQASALLIPLSSNIQDQARFPFKISEYTASKTPIITSNTGAIKEYFTNNENVLMANADDIEDFSEKINFIVDFPNKAKDIGLRGYELGKDKFNYKSYAELLRNFILS